MSRRKSSLKFDFLLRCGKSMRRIHGTGDTVSKHQVQWLRKDRVVIFFFPGVCTRSSLIDSKALRYSMILRYYCLFSKKFLKRFINLDVCEKKLCFFSACLRNDSGIFVQCKPMIRIRFFFFYIMHVNVRLITLILAFNVTHVDFVQSRARFSFSN